VNCRIKERETNIKYVGKCALQIKGKIITNSVKEAIRIEDANESLREYVKEKYKYNAYFIDLKARDTFSNKKVTVSMIICSYGFNYYRVRDTGINKNLKGDKCLRYSLPKTWEHMIQCKETKQFRKKFIQELAKEMFKERS